MGACFGFAMIICPGAYVLRSRSMSLSRYRAERPSIFLFLAVWKRNVLLGRLRRLWEAAANRKGSEVGIFLLALAVRDLVLRPTLNCPGSAGQGLVFDLSSVPLLGKNYPVTISV